MNRRVKTILSVIALALLIVGLIGMFRFYGGTSLPVIEKGAYRIVAQEAGMAKQVSKLLASGDQIVLFYQDEGYASIYTPEGKFCYGIQVDVSDKGYGNAAWVDGLLVIKSKENTVYFFDGKTLTSRYHVSINENLEQFQTLEEKMGSNNSLSCETESGVVSVSGSQVVETDASGAVKELFSLPRKTINPGFLVSFFIGAVLVIIVDRVDRSRRAKRNGPSSSPQKNLP